MRAISATDQPVLRCSAQSAVLGFVRRKLAMRNVATFILLFAVWMLWSGHSEPLLLWLGGGSCLLVLWVSRRMDLLDAEAMPFHLTLRLLGYVPWLLWQIVVTNLDVAKRILSPDMKLHSHLVRFPASQKTDFGRVLHANTITLTPGTVTVDVQDGHFLVHALSDAAADAEGAQALDRKISKMEGE